MLGLSLLWFFTGFLVLASLAPLAKVPFGAIRGLEFPREQYFVFAAVLSPVMFLVQPGRAGLTAAAALIGVALFQLFYIIKFTPIWSRQSVAATPQERQDISRRISLLAANVKKSNRQYDPLIDMVRARAPDIVMAIEVDEAWIEALKPALVDEYAQWVEVPRDNGYGICVMSKLPLSETEVRDLITDGVPSVRTCVTLRDGSALRLYVVHPEPPVINHDTVGRDSEIALVGLEASNDPLPAIVTGDLNDVAWSTTTRRFQRLSGLLDPRVGRGFYNTFNALIPMMRWPLDHLFHDPMFRLVEMDRLPKIGSDHFPMWFVLSLADDEAQHISPGTADIEEEMQSKRMIVEERKREREALGSHWEDE